MIIDAHFHLWDPRRGDYSWLAPDSPLHRAYRQLDYDEAIDGLDIQASILVQAAPTSDETDYLLELARASFGRWIGVVGWVDLAAVDAPARIAKRASNPLLVGVRPMLQDLEKRDWILRPELDAAIDALARHKLTFDALVNADQLKTIAEFATRHPDLQIVLDHAGKPPLGMSLSGWKADISNLAGLPNVACKLSGIATELPPGAGRHLIDQTIEFLFERFGGDKLIWGSDWPVCTLATTAKAWLERCLDHMQRQDPDCRDAIFGGNARRFYRLGVSAPAQR